MKKLFLTSVVSCITIVLMAQTKTINTPTRSNILNEEYCSPHFRHADGTLIDLTEDNASAIAYTNILDWLVGRVAGLQVYNFRNNLKVPFIRGSQASIYVDEMPVDAGYLNLLPITEIALIKIIKGPVAATMGGNHVIAVYTWQPEVDDEEEER